MKTKLLIGIGAALLAGCGLVNQEEARQERLVVYKAESAARSAEHKKQMKKIEDEYAPKVQTQADKEKADRECDLYYAGLVRSIKSLDDKVSRADSVGRAAISENLDQLKAWKRASMAHEARASEWANKTLEDSIAKLPGRNLLDEAASIVLRNRNGTLDW